MNIKHLNIILLSTTFILTGCSSFTDYFKNLTSEERKDLVVYKTNKQYEDTQFDLLVPPDLITPNSSNILEIPDDDAKGVGVVTVDTPLDTFTIMRSGRDSFLMVKSQDKHNIWSKLSSVWRSDSFMLVHPPYTLGSMRTSLL